MPVTYCDVLGFLWRSVQAMACFFDCFGVRNNNHHHHHRRHQHHHIHNNPRPQLVPHDSPTSNARVGDQEEVRQKIRLSSLFTAEENDETAAKAPENEVLVRRAGRSDVHEELVEEAKFLKACGTLPETPAEIRKRVTIVENFDNSDIQRPCSMQEFSPDTPVEIQKAETLERPDLQNSPNVLESSPETPDEVQRVGTFAENSVKLDAQRPQSVLKSSPYPTPVKISDDMQTPGTVFATNMKSLTKGNGRIRSQYVYTVLNPIENLCQLDELKEEDTTLNASDHEGGSKQGNATPSAVGSSKCSVNEEKLGDVSLSAWLKPPASKYDDDHHNLGAASYRKPKIGRTPGDRPIIGLVATHWNDQEEASHISPKGWDGNGIPNSTTKYKEDQKVCWHATPFEERLEKAMSEETVAPQRKPITGAPISFEDIEGQDTASSQLQSISCPKSVVSF
ncbi:protein JASON-like [Chenopodium quinoa]|nr:protein JASON-like [Chenopodium quinoa]